MFKAVLVCSSNLNLTTNVAELHSSYIIRIEKIISPVIFNAQ